MVTLYNVVSQDGFIARPDGSEDFIPNEDWERTLALFRRYDTVILGRKTYEALQQYEATLLNPFERLPFKRVVMTRDNDFHPKAGYLVVHSPQEAATVGSSVLVSSGPGLNNVFLRAGLVAEIIQHVVPVSIREGIKPFDEAYVGNVRKMIE